MVWKVKGGKTIQTNSENYERILNRMEEMMLQQKEINKELVSFLLLFTVTVILFMIKCDISDMMFYL